MFLLSKVVAIVWAIEYGITFAEQPPPAVTILPQPAALPAELPTILVDDNVPQFYTVGNATEAMKQLPSDIPPPSQTLEPPKMTPADFRGNNFKTIENANVTTTDALKPFPLDILPPSMLKPQKTWSVDKEIHFNIIGDEVVPVRDFQRQKIVTDAQATAIRTQSSPSEVQTTETKPQEIATDVHSPPTGPNGIATEAQTKLTNSTETHTQSTTTNVEATVVGAQNIPTVGQTVETKPQEMTNEAQTTATKSQESVAASEKLPSIKFPKLEQVHPKALFVIGLNRSRNGIETPKDSNNDANVPILAKLFPANENEYTALQVWRSPDGKVHLQNVEATEEAKKLGPQAELVNVVDRMEAEAEQRFHVCYLKIARLNDYKYQLDQAKQYLHLSEEQLKEDERRIQRMKLEIKVAYLKCRVFMKLLEKYRAKLTTWPNDNSNTFISFMKFFPQPKVIPETWYLFYNLESIIMQLFTPKPKIHTFYEEETHSIRMSRQPIIMMIPRHFIPVPQYNEPHQPSVDLSRLFGDNQVANSEGDPFHTARFSKDPFEQRVIMYYLANYYRYKASDCARSIHTIVDKLTALHGISNPTPEVLEGIRKRKEQLADRMKETHYVAYQMQAYKEDLELTQVFKAEEAASKYLDDDIRITKLEGDDIKRVAIKTREETLATLETKGGSDTAHLDNNINETIDDPFEWNENQIWDY